jgi:hypothetical protein
MGASGIATPFQHLFEISQAPVKVAEAFAKLCAKIRNFALAFGEQAKNFVKMVSALQLSHLAA